MKQVIYFDNQRDVTVMRHLLKNKINMSVLAVHVVESDASFSGAYTDSAKTGSCFGHQSSTSPPIFGLAARERLNDTWRIFHRTAFDGSRQLS